MILFRHTTPTLLFTILFAAFGAQAALKSDNFVLLDHNGSAQELYYHGDASAIVLISQISDCEAVEASIPDYRQLKSDYADKNIRFFMINSIDSRATIAAKAAEWGLDIPVLHDDVQIIGQSLEITASNEVLVIDPKNWQIVYRGAVKSDALRATMDTLIAGDTAAYQQTAHNGCAVSYNENDVASYAEEIVPILKQNCMACHIEGGIAPWAMSEYRMVLGFAPMMREVIRVKRMPPWHADPEIGHWKNSAAMSNEDTKTLVNWLEAGAPRGEGPDPLLNPRPIKEQWPLGEPDLILTVPSFDVPATGVVEYQFPVVDNPLDRDVWVEAATVLPGNTKVVHHVLMGSAEQKPKQDDREGVFQNYIMGYAPGNESAHMPEGTGVFVPVGGVYQLQLHYTPIGIAATDETKVGLYFADEAPDNFLRQQVVLNPRIKIPPNTEAHEESAYFEFWGDATIHSLVPHSHYRGKSSTFELQYPDGTLETVLSVPNYDFNWQRTYSFVEPKKVPKGTRIIHKTVYDNSTKNPANPAPDEEVTWGLQSHEEMLYGSVSYSWDAETSAAPIHSNQTSDVAQFIGFMDKDMSGKAEKEELPKRMQENLPWYKWIFVDQNFDGGLDVAEMEALFDR
ncbi:MAG: redoxin domain-containing protein [Pseudomonadales bacterium]